MNFDDIKAKMDAEPMDNAQIPTKIVNFENSKLPIQKVERSMRSEIFTQLICILIFLAVPSFVEMHSLPKGIYYILMFVTSLITIGYLIKMSGFLKKNSKLSESSRETIVAYIHDLKITLEVYKTAIISGSLLLPISLLTFVLGREKVDEEIFTNLIMLNIPSTTLVAYIAGYIVLAILIYFITVRWSNSIYGVHIQALEKLLKEFEE